MSEQTYNGWTNYETWNVKLWLDNEPGTQSDMDEMAMEYLDDDYAHRNALEEYVREMMPGLGATMAADLLGSALDNVNWGEIAFAYREDLPESDDED